MITNNYEIWMERALCRQTDAEIFFPSKDNEATTDGLMTTIRKAKSICGRCPVRMQCLEYALSAEERYGVWGGENMSTMRNRDRELLRRKYGFRVRAAREPDFEHGGPTDAGARRHYRRGEKPCPECAASALRYGRERRA